MAKKVSACIFIMLCSAVAFAETNEKSRVIDAAGGIATSYYSFLPSYSCRAAVGQGTTVGYSYNGEYLNHAGFMQTESNAPTSATDTDGDGLHDWVEMSGSSFNPLTPTDTHRSDSDGDGQSDGMEALSGTNPHDGNAYLQILSVSGLVDSPVVAWTAREGFQYEIIEAGTVLGLRTNYSIFSTSTAGSGSGVWHQTTATQQLSPTNNPAFFSVQVKK